MVSRAISLPASVVLASVVLISSCTQQPQTFEDCVLANMRGVTTNAAANSINRACRVKFPEAAASKAPVPEVRPSAVLPQDALQAISTELNVFQGKAVGSIHNGTSQWVLRNVTVRLRQFDREGGVLEQAYRTKLDLPPLAAEVVVFPVGMRDHPTQFTVVAAEGELVSAGADR